MTDGAGFPEAVAVGWDEEGLGALSKDFAMAKGSGTADGDVKDGCAEYIGDRASCEAGACSKLFFAEDGPSAGVFE